MRIYVEIKMVIFVFGFLDIVFVFVKTQNPKTKKKYTHTVHKTQQNRKCEKGKEEEEAKSAANLSATEMYNWSPAWMPEVSFPNGFYATKPIFLFFLVLSVKKSTTYHYGLFFCFIVFFL